MKAISLWQPWASLWLTSAKTHETRSWRTSYRGPLLVHAVQRKPVFGDTDLEGICVEEFGPYWRSKLYYGAIVGAIDLKDCVRTDETTPTSLRDLQTGDWSPGRYAWRRGAVARLLTPVLWTGKQGLFEVDSEVVESWAREALGAVVP